LSCINMHFHSSALLCTPLHSSALLCTPLHSSALLCTPLHSSALPLPSLSHSTYGSLQMQRALSSADFSFFALDDPSLTPCMTFVPSQGILNDVHRAIDVLAKQIHHKSKDRTKNKQNVQYFIHLFMIFNYILNCLCACVLLD
jgi:hypothetical protein